jgi:hypothetical protein
VLKRVIAAPVRVYPKVLPDGRTTEYDSSLIDVSLVTIEVHRLRPVDRPVRSATDPVVERSGVAE